VSLYLGIQRLLRSFDFLVGLGFALDQRQAVLQRLTFLVGIQLVLDGFQARLDAGGGELALVGLGIKQRAFFAALLLVQLFQLTAAGIAFGFQLADGGRLGSVVAAHDQLGWQQVGIGLAFA